MVSALPVTEPVALQASCSVCGDAAASHLHYGAISCYSCRAFFRWCQEGRNKFRLKIFADEASRGRVDV